MCTYIQGFTWYVCWYPWLIQHLQTRKTAEMSPEGLRCIAKLFEYFSTSVGPSGETQGQRSPVGNCWNIQLDFAFVTSTAGWYKPQRSGTAWSKDEKEFITNIHNVGAAVC